MDQKCKFSSVSTKVGLGTCKEYNFLIKKNFRIFAIDSQEAMRLSLLKN
ncbi:hypothetical protein LEP1GSC021_1588 [Leptospira noguchii str. 1993005606]|nr:hypothetical protein LEP1GSC021_1588 [Leptospira noguchii str. 1993005606]